MLGSAWRAGLTRLAPVRHKSTRRHADTCPQATHRHTNTGQQAQATHKHTSTGPQATHRPKKETGQPKKRNKWTETLRFDDDSNRLRLNKLSVD